MPNVTQAIKENISITDYAEMIGYHPVQRSGTGRSYCLKEHDSCVITYDSNGLQSFFWNSRQQHGSVIDFAMAAQGYTQDEAISELRNIMGGKSKAFWQERRAPPSPPKENVPFVLPKVDHTGWKKVIAYLNQTRGINPDVIKWLIKQKIVYPALSTFPSGVQATNACFVNYDKNGKADYATLKGIYSEGTFRHVVRGGNYDARFGINLTGQKVAGMFVTEAAVDVFAIMSLLHENGKDFTHYGYLSLDCCDGTPLLYHLKNNPQILRVWLAQDNDTGGELSRKHCREIVEAEKFPREIKLIDKLPTQKDFDEDLQNIRAAQQLQPSQQLSPARELELMLPR